MIGKFFKKNKRNYQAIEPDEILIDAANIPSFDRTRLEGKLERPLGEKTFRGFTILAALVFLVAAGQLFSLQIFGHAAFAARAEANRLSHTTVMAERGLIVDRSGKPLADNAAGKEGYPLRVYPLGEAAAPLLGYVSYPKQDQNGYWYQEDTKGVSGIEASFNESLAGQNGLQIAETDAKGDVVSGAIVRDAQTGETVHLSLDADLQKELYDQIKARADQSGWRGGAGVIMDIETGQLLAVASYPSFDPSVMSSGEPKEEVQRLLTDSRAPFLDRAISGLYTPGSVVKPFMSAAALQERVISPDKKILSTGSISVPNPYDPAHPSVFKDWRVNGWVDVRHAIAVSSDVYFYEVGGGFEDQPGLGISRIERYMKAFGFGAESGAPFSGEQPGVIPDPEWKAKVFDDEPWYLGDTYHTAIGQYGFQINLMQLVRGVAALANGGTLISPVIQAGKTGIETKVPVSSENLEIVREGMRLCVTEGICQALAVPGMKAAGKTGTAEVGVNKESVNSLVEGFFPYDHPRYAFVVAMERAKAGTPQGAPSVMGNVLQWIAANKPDIANSDSPQ
jgi:penicillin-binding protein 2